MPPIKVHVLHCGRVRIDNALPFRQASLHPAAFTGWLRNPAFQVWLPVTCYLIEHPDGMFLVDTGWNAAVRDSARDNLGGFHMSLNKADLPEGQAIHEQLAARGVKPSDLDAVIITHLHGDHAGGLHHVLDAKRHLLSDIEFRHGEPHRKMWGDTQFEQFSYADTGIGPKDRSFDLLGDGSVNLVHTPGHTAGLSSLLVKRDDRFFLMFADVCYSQRSWEQGLLPGITFSLDDAKTSLAWVRRMNLETGCVESHASHQVSAPHTVEI